MHYSRLYRTGKAGSIEPMRAYTLTPELAAIHKCVSIYKSNALRKSRTIEWALTIAQARELFEGRCFYCDDEPSMKITGHRNKGLLIYNGIDRKNPDEGYVMGNVVSCCTKCNQSKWTMTDKEYLEHCRKVVEHNAVPTLLE